jgi:tagaturonate epimerase
LAKEVYSQAFAHKEALCDPYAAVIDIDYAKLPLPAEVAGWSSKQYTDALRHVQSNPNFNPNVRQLLHVGYKVAAQMGDRYLKMLKNSEESISRNVCENIFDRHIKPLFLD